MKKNIFEKVMILLENKSNETDLHFLFLEMVIDYLFILQKWKRRRVLDLNSGGFCREP